MLWNQYWDRVGTMELTGPYSELKSFISNAYRKSGGPIRPQPRSIGREKPISAGLP